MDGQHIAMSKPGVTFSYNGLRSALILKDLHFFISFKGYSEFTFFGQLWFVLIGLIGSVPSADKTRNLFSLTSDHHDMFLSQAKVLKKLSSLTLTIVIKMYSSV